MASTMGITARTIWTIRLFTGESGMLSRGGGGEGQQVGALVGQVLGVEGEAAVVGQGAGLGEARRCGWRERRGGGQQGGGGREVSGAIQRQVTAGRQRLPGKVGRGAGWGLPGRGAR